MIGNSLQLFVHCETGDTMSKDPLTKPLSIPTIIITPTSETHRNWTDDRQDGLLSFLNIISSLFTFLEPKWFNQMSFLVDPISILTRIMITRTLLFYLTIFLSTWLILTFNVVLRHQILINNKPILFYCNKCYVPKNLEIRLEIIAQYHNVPNAGHPSKLETYNALRAHYWWSGMRTFVKNYVKDCAFCQQFKINWHPSKLVLMPIPGPTSTCSFMDFITDLPPIRGLDSIFSVVDHGLTKGIILVPCSKLGPLLTWQPQWSWTTSSNVLDYLTKSFSIEDHSSPPECFVSLWNT